MILAEPKEGKASLTVQFDATRSTDPAGPITDCLWDFGDGSSVASGAQVFHTFRRAGEYLVTLVVVGPSGTGRDTVLIRVLNNPPVASCGCARAGHNASQSGGMPGWPLWPPLTLRRTSDLGAV